MSEQVEERAFGQWKELLDEVVSPGLCTGCAACIVACPRKVLDYERETYHPFNFEDTTPADDCIHGQRGCDICTKACPRFRLWEIESDVALFGRARRADEPVGMYREILLVRTTDERLAAGGQDGGLVSALLCHGLDEGLIDGALVSKLSDERPWDVEPFLATSREDVIATAGSRYTYSANPLAMKAAQEQKLKSLALVGMSCQASINGTANARNVAQLKRKIALTIGLLCSKSFAYKELMVDTVAGEYGIPLDDVAKVNVKGKFIVWRRSTGEQIDIPLKQLHPYTREGCKMCPDFSAEHADISCGGLGQSSGWTLTIVRTERGAEWIDALKAKGLIQTRPGTDDPAAIDLMHKLAIKQRKRWEKTSATGDAAAPGLLPEPDAAVAATRR